MVENVVVASFQCDEPSARYHGGHLPTVFKRSGGIASTMQDQRRLGYFFEKVAHVYMIYCVADSDGIFGRG